MKYIKGNLLDCDDNIAHCVSVDFKMGAGIAKQIVAKYGRDVVKADLHQIGYKIVDNKYILYIVTKVNYWNKPSLSDMKESLKSLAIFCEENDITSLSIPKIGCGLDALKWSDVKKLIKKYLSELEVTVYCL